MGPAFGKSITDGMRNLLQNMPIYISSSADLKNRFASVFSVIFSVMFPLMVAIVVISVVVTMAQTRLLITPSQLKPDFSRLSPIKGIKRLFSLKSFVELFKSLLKITVVGLIIYLDINPQLQKVMLLFDTSLNQSFIWTANAILDIGFKASFAILLIGVADYFYQWWSFEKEIKMTKEETKEEYKQTEGNPEIKGRMRSLQRRLARSRMMQAVPSADVVIRNPTHYAVAIKYEGQGQNAPVVVAKGRDLVALRIVEVAEKNKIYVTENVPLAQALFKAVEIGDEIPSEFYKAVAEVLAYIYRLKKAGRV
jgi:flagellar biosynthetic protein FlhB